MGSNPLSSLLILMLGLSQMWPVGTPSSHLGGHFCFCHKMVRAHPPSPSPALRHFAKDPWFLFVGNAIRTRDLEARCAHCDWGVIACVWSVDRLGKTAISCHFSCSPFYNILVAFSSPWEAWLPTKSIYLLLCWIVQCTLVSCVRTSTPTPLFINLLTD